LIVAGGGVRNRALMQEIMGRAGVPVDTSDVHGVPASLREAVAFAVLGALSADRVAITLPRVTGVDRAPIAGSWVWPG
jgi:anhydro-N-acetylmuramic acid kinase